MHFLTIKDYTGIRHSHCVHGNTGIVSIVFFWYIEKNEQGLFALILDFNSIKSI